MLDHTDPQCDLPCNPERLLFIFIFANVICIFIFHLHLNFYGFSIICFFCICFVVFFFYCHNNGKKMNKTPSPNANIRHVSRAARPPATVPNDDVSVRAGMGRGGGGADSDIASSAAGEGDVIWGTNVNLDTITRQFRDFLENFTDDNTLFIYPELIEDAIESQTWCLSLNCNDLYTYNKDLYLKLVRFPQEVLPAFDTCVNDYADENYSDLLAESGLYGNGNNGSSEEIWVRPYNIRDVRSMRNMNPLDIDTLVGIRGMVIRSSTIIPDIQTAFFRCQLCNNEVEVAIEMGRIVEPNKCTNNHCQGSNCMELIHNRSVFQDKQLVKIQETPENIPDGETPQTIDVYVFDSLVDKCKPGDRVEVTGVYRASAIRRNPRRRVVEAVYKTYIDVVHIHKIQNNELLSGIRGIVNSEQEDTEMAGGAGGSQEAGAGLGAGLGLSVSQSVRRQEREDEIKELGQDPNIYERLTNSFAPSIFEMQDIKKGILCQLFGASDKNFGELGKGGHGNNFRNQLNVILCGDPGTSKSQLLQYVHKVSRRGIYTSGKGSSAVGLTAYITKDPDSGDLILESGALVLSDLGICCIDEFDKMSDSARSILHEVMEQQTVSIAKAGIICTLNARTSILAAANPKESRYNPQKSVVENIDLEPTLLSRFDLIYLVLDRPNEQLDRRLARHIVSLYYDDNENEDNENDDNDNTEELIDSDLFNKYIEYSRRHINPRLSDEAGTRLVAAYLELRSLGRSAGKKVITATPRQLESLIRISESLARMRHSKIVTVDDVNEALRLHKVATLAAATDPTTGAIDLDAIAVGRTQEQGRELERQATIVLEILSEYPRKTIRAKTLRKKYNERAQNDESGNTRQIDMGQLRKIVERLEQSERIRASEWTVDDPYITVYSTDPL